MRFHVKCYYSLETRIGIHAEVLVPTVTLGMIYASSRKVVLLFSNMDRWTCGGSRFLVTVRMFMFYVSSLKVLLFFINMDRETCGGPSFLVTVGMFICSSSLKVLLFLVTWIGRHVEVLVS